MSGESKIKSGPNPASPDRPLSLAYSPCPNDTYIFDALAHDRIDAGGLTFNITLADVESLNQAAAAGLYDITKLSVAAFGHVSETYGMLGAGAALGRGCGPLLVARKGTRLEEISGKAIAVPGMWTTAYLLLALFMEHPPHATAMTFDQIMPAVQAGKYDAGVIIHEGRFTYETYGLTCLADLGQWWESVSGLPIPLGCIAIRRSLGAITAGKMTSAIRASITHARRHPGDALPYIRANAREMDDAVIHQHIALYVNEFSMDLGDEGLGAVAALLDRARQTGIVPETAAPVLVG
jgi:1,4-dihydroxy-6-naphthoate synthase